MGIRFSIVVPTLNRKDMLLCALASVRAQNWPDVEVIVVDGGSSDGTLEALSKQPDVRILTGPDKGVYDALNKGIGHGSGDVVGLLNSDDSYESEAFVAVAAAFDANPDAASVCGTSVLEERGRIIAVFSRSEDKALASPRTALIGSCTPNARFFRRAAMQRIGPFSLDYRYVADRDWLVRWTSAGLRTIAIDKRVYSYRQHAGSLTFDPSRQRDEAIRNELFALARRWKTEPTANASIRRMATLLEGRCRASLATAALRRGSIAEAARWLLLEDGHASLAPIGSVIRGGADRSIAQIFPGWR
jgi:glycosyltransferase involved in cell wall biosynthesis